MTKLLEAGLPPPKANRLRWISSAWRKDANILDWPTPFDLERGSISASMDHRCEPSICRTLTLQTYPLHAGEVGEAQVPCPINTHTGTHSTQLACEFCRVSLAQFETRCDGSHSERYADPYSQLQDNSMRSAL
jgi:hypothetical protein